MPWMPAMLDIKAAAAANAGKFLSLHSATPDATGSSETTAARLPANWVTPSVNPLGLTAPRAFTGGAPNGPVAAIGVWSAATGGTFYGYSAITGDASFNSAGEFTLDTLSSTDV